MMPPRFRSSSGCLWSRASVWLNGGELAREQIARVRSLFVSSTSLAGSDQPSIGLRSVIPGVGALSVEGTTCVVPGTTGCTQISLGGGGSFGCVAMDVGSGVVVGGRVGVI
jgi:hypothetical protein